MLEIRQLRRLSSRRSNSRDFLKCALSVMFLVQFSSWLVDATNEIFMSLGDFNSKNMRCSPGVGSTGILQMSPSADTGARVSAGRCLFNESLSLFDDSENSKTQVSSFSTTFTFSMFNADAALNPGSSSSSALVGFAFILVADGNPEAGYNTTVPHPCCRETLQYMGILNETSNGKNYSSTLAVEFHVYNPSMNLMFDDPPYDHVGINVNSMNSTLKARAATYVESLPCQAPQILVPMNLSDGKLIQAWIDYRGDTGQVNVSISSDLGQKPSRALLAGMIDLGSVVRQNMYAGFSSAGYTDGDKTPTLIHDWSLNIGDENAALLYPESLDSRCGTSPAFFQSVRTNFTAVYVSAISCLAIVVCLLCLLAVLLSRRKRELRKEFEVLELENLEYGPIKYTFRALSAATDGFDGRRSLGEGELGTFYRAVLGPGGRVVAVKRIPRSPKVSESDIAAKVRTLGRLRHRNLVELQGWCFHRNDLLLVYEFSPCGSLDRVLFSDDAKHLSWSQRLHILKGVAAALVYLHEECGSEKPIVHGCVKASNVLLDGEGNPRLGDYGFTRRCDRGDCNADGAGVARYRPSHMSTDGRVTEKSDVQNFGTLILQLVSGRQPVEAAGPLSSENGLAKWALGLYQAGRFEDLLDWRLGHDFLENEVMQMLDIGLLCCHREFSQRLSMRKVKLMLNGESAIPPLPSFKSEGALASVLLDWDDSAVVFATPEITMIDSPEMGPIASFKDTMGTRAASRDSVGKRSRSFGN